MEPADPNIIFLVGYRGSGKTAVAQVLAGKLGWDWLDADSLLEQRHGLSIKQIFAGEGEAGFRDKEAGLLPELCGRRRCVIATGGGIVLRSENRERLRSSGLVIWLTADAATLWQRIEQDSSTAQRRPNLAGGGVSEVQELLRVREPLYCEVARMTVSTAGRLPEQIADAIIQELAATGTSHQ